MVNQIVVLGRIDAEEFRCDHPWGCISIATVPGDHPPLRRRNRVALLQLVFADITTSDARFAHFEDEHAHDILDFVTHHWDEMETLLIHCDAGISRSSAVAAVISRLKFGEESEFFEEPFEPNPLVYRTLREVASGRADYQDDDSAAEDEEPQYWEECNSFDWDEEYVGD